MPSLVALAASGVAVPWVVTQPDRPAGRGRRLSPSPVKQCAVDLGIVVHQPEGLRVSDVPPPAWGPAPNLIVVVAYGLLLPRWLLGWPEHGCVNVHASLLPRWRGAAPVQHALMAGDRQTGVSLMQLDAGLDTGPVFARRSTPIGSRETAGALLRRLSDLGAAMLVDQLPGLLAGAASAMPQDHTGATYAPKISKADARLDWNQPADVLARRVRAYNPWPVAEARLMDGRRLRIWEAEAVTHDGSAKPGQIIRALADGIDVATPDGALRLLTVQSPSARAVPVAAWLAAHPLDDARFVV